MKKRNRRSFLKQSTTLTALAGTSVLPLACQPEKKTKFQEAPYINFSNSYEWKMVTTWPPNFPVVGEGCNLFAQWVETMSGGRMKIQVYGGGELVPSLETFEAVSNGAVELGHGAGYYWAGKVPAAQFFTAVPFGMNAQQMNAWIISGGGAALWEAVYDRFNLLPMICGNTGVQMGGWFNKEINSAADLQGLKMRMPGLGGKVLSKAGGTALLVAGGEIYTNLERGVIDATEWIGPYHDYIMGFYRVAKYYYYPGWQETGPVLELIINKPKFQQLPTDLQEIIRTAAMRSNNWMLAEFDEKNCIYLNKLIKEEKVDVRPFPDEVLDQLQSYTTEVIEELVAKDPESKKVFDAYRTFKEGLEPWSIISEKEFYRQFVGKRE